MFRKLIYPSSEACDCSVELPQWSYFSWLEAEACNTDTTPTQPHQNSNTHRTKNNTTNVVIQENSRKLLMMDILMSETCWAHMKWNKIASDIKLVFYSSTITYSCLSVTLVEKHWLRLFESRVLGKILTPVFPHKLSSLQSVLVKLFLKPVHNFTPHSPKLCTVILCVQWLLAFLPHLAGIHIYITYLLTYLLHGAESFFRS